MQGKVLVAESEGVYILKLVGDVRLILCSTIDQFVSEMFAGDDLLSVVIDLTETEGIDSTTLGVLAKMALYAEEHFKLTPAMVSTNEHVTRLIHSMGFASIFNIVASFVDVPDANRELLMQDMSEECAREKVLEAHRVLMSLNDANRDVFSDLVENLESAALQKL